MLKNKTSFHLIYTLIALPCLAAEDNKRPPALQLSLRRTYSPDDIAYHNFSSPRHEKDDTKKLMENELAVVELSQEPTIAKARRTKLREQRNSTVQLADAIKALPFEQQRYVLDPIAESCSLSIQPTQKKDDQTTCERAGEFLLDNGGNLVSGLAGVVSFGVSIDDLFVDYLPDDATNADSWLTFLLIPTFTAGQIYQYARFYYKLYQFRKMNKEYEQRYHDLQEAMREQTTDETE